MTAFADTFALIAWLNASDSAHGEVVTYLSSYSGRLLTTEWVLMELADALSSPTTRATVVPFLRSIRNDPSIEIVGYDSAVYEAGSTSSRRGRTRTGHSPTDCISFSVMSQRGITEALTQDQHFIQAGFRAVF